jgi:hypothetical protein
MYYELMQDPRGTLARKEIRIASRSLLTAGLIAGLVGLLLLPLVLLWWWTPLLFFLFLGCLATAVIFTGFGLWYGRPEIVLRDKGVTIQDGRYEVFCPWSLFNASGTPFYRQGVPEKVLVPVAPQAVPLIELRADGCYLGHESRQRVRHLLTITKPDEIALSGWYQANLVEVANLLLQLGPILAPQGTRQAAAVHQAPATLPAGPAAPDSGGWITVGLTQLIFPPLCCRCGAATSATVTYQLSPRWAWLWSVVTHMHQYLEVPLPVCEPCQADDRRRLWRGIGIGLVAGPLLLIVPAALSGENIWAEFFWLVAGGAILGGCLGWIIVERPPLTVRHYSPRQGNVTIRFRNRGYTEPFLRHAAAQQPEGRAKG